MRVNVLTAESTGPVDGGLRVRFTALGPSGAPPLALLLSSVAFHDARGARLGTIADVALDLTTIAEHAWIAEVDISPSSLREISLDFAVLREGAGPTPQRFRGRVEGCVVSPGPWRAEVRVEVDAGALTGGGGHAPFRFLAAAPAVASFDLAEWSGDAFAMESLYSGLIPGAAFQLDAAGLGGAGTVTLSERDPGALPSLLHLQAAFGPALHVDSTRRPAPNARLCLPFAPEAVRAAGLDAADLVVLALDDAGARYRELRPVTVDERAGTLTVLVDSFSSFFPGSPGIRIDTPTLFVNHIGERVCYTNGSELMVAGEVTDERVIVEIDGIAADRAGLAFGRGRIPAAGAGDRVIEVTARRPDRSDGRPHTVQISVRRHPPPQRVAFGSPLLGHEMTVDGHNRPCVSYGTAIGTGDEADLTAFLAGDWNRLLPHYGHALAVTEPGQSGTSWKRLEITDPAEMHEELAASVIAHYQQLRGPGLPPVRLTSPDPVGTRSIRSIAAFIAENGDNAAAIAVLFGVFRLRWTAFAPGVLTYSPTAPIAALDDGVTLAAAYVHATREGMDVAAASGVRDRLRELFERTTPVRATVTDAEGKEQEVIQDTPLEPTSVTAGRLVFGRSLPTPVPAARRSASRRGSGAPGSRSRSTRPRVSRWWPRSASRRTRHRWGHAAGCCCSAGRSTAGGPRR